MAAEEPAEAARHSANYSVLIHSDYHVFRTGRLEAARGRQHGREPSLVDTKYANYEFLHRRNSRVTSRSKSCMGASNAPRRGLITTSHPGPKLIRCIRTASRNRRFKRFRTTALPSPLGVVNPTLGNAS